MRDLRNRCMSAELIEEEAARIPDPNHWRAIALREMARMERECWEVLFPASAARQLGRPSGGSDVRSGFPPVTASSTGSVPQHR
jgi:hypothetical protein